MKSAKNFLTPKLEENSSSVEEDDKIDEIIGNIKLLPPRSAYTHFCIDEAHKFKMINKQKINITKSSAEWAKKWARLSQNEKAKYQQKYEEEKTKYKKDLQLINHYLFKDYNDVVRRPPTAYRIYLNEKLIEGFETNKDPKLVKAQASKDWKNMTPKEKKIYFDKKKENDNWFEKAKSIKNVNSVSIFIQKTFDTAKKKNLDFPKLGDVASSWKNLSQNEKKKYKKYAEEINEERENLFDLYELIKGVKPRKPVGAFRIFLQEKAKEKILHNLTDGKNLWGKLSEEEKEIYLKKSHKAALAYKYKNMIYKNKIRKILPKKPGNAFALFLKEKKGIKIDNEETPGIYWGKIFNSLPKEQKKKYELKAEAEKEKYLKQLEKFKDAVFDMPKKPLNAFNLYIRDRLSKTDEDMPINPMKERLKQFAEDWKKEKESVREKFEEMSERDKERFSKQLKSFNKLGYYILNKRDRMKNRYESEESEKEKSVNVKKRADNNKKRHVSSTSRKKEKKRKNSTTTKKRSRNSTKKMEKTQKSK